MDPPPQRIGPYHLLEPLGRGGMGVVYRAEHHESGQQAALKTVRLPDPQYLDSIRREIRALARIHHAGIVRILDEGVHEGMPWYAMELLEGVTLGRFRANLAGPVARPLPEVPADLATAAAASAALGVPTREEPAASSMPAGPELTVTVQDLLGVRAAGVPREADPALLEPTHQVSAAALGLPPDAGHRMPPMPLGLALTLARRLCLPLAYLHGEGLVHRDLKPGNILLRNEERGTRNEEREGGSLVPRSSILIPVLIDFGLLSHFSGDLGREVLELGGLTVGTAHYMAPEQVRGELVDARADLYALGCILFELLTGRHLFESAETERVLLGHLHQRPPGLRELVPEAPAELEELLERLLAKEPRERLGHADVVASMLESLGAERCSEEAQHRPRSYLYRPALAGRTRTLEALARHVTERLQTGRGGLVLVGGESGIGKTRLCQELGRLAVQRGTGVLLGECLPAASSAQRSAPGDEQRAGGPSGQPACSSLLGAGSAPLQPWRGVLQAVGDLCCQGGAAGTERLLGTHGKLLAAYEPALAGLPGMERHPEPVELPPEAARLRLFHALAGTLAALVSSSPLLVVLDDLQWADELSLGFVEWLSRTRRLEAMPLMLLGTYRSEEVVEALGRLLQPGAAQLLPLERLGEASVGRIVQDMLALEAPPGLFVGFLARHSEGNPFFVAEYLRAAVAEGLLYRDEAGRWQVRGEGKASEALYEALPLPRSLRDLVGRRLEGLSAGALELLEAAAVLGREAATELLSRVAGAAQPELMEASSELLARQVLEEPAPGRLRFVHDKIREVTYAGLENARREVLHRTIAQELDRLEPQVRELQLEMLGHHWERGGEPRRAAPCYLAAARRVLKSYAFEDAERLYRQVLALVPEPAAESVAARSELAGEIYCSRGRLDEARLELQRALHESRILADQAAETHCLFHLGQAFWYSGEIDEARRCDTEALALCRQRADHGTEAQLLCALASLEHVQGRFAEAGRLYHEALALARKTGNRPTEGRALVNLAFTHQVQGRHAEALALYREGLALGQQMGDHYVEANAVDGLGHIHAAMDRTVEAIGYLEAALALYRESGARRAEGWTLANLATCLVRVGRVEEGRVLFPKALTVFHEIGERKFEAVFQSARFLLELWAGGDVESLEARLEWAESELRRLNDPMQLILVLCRRGHLLLVRKGSARALLDEALRVAGASGVDARTSSEEGGALRRLQHAQEAFEAGQAHRLFRGVLPEDLPEGLRRWLVQTGQLAEARP